MNHENQYMSKKALDRLVYDYLHTHGFIEAADQLLKESKYVQSVSLYTRQCSIPTESRIIIRDCVLSGDMTGAQREISKKHPAFFDHNDELLFEIRLQQLLEYINSGQIEKALEIANTAISTLVNGPERLERVQEALSLLVDSSTPRSTQLLDPQTRLQLWRKLNKVMLRERTASNSPGASQSALDSIYQIGCWSNRKLQEYSNHSEPGAQLTGTESFAKILEDKIMMVKPGLNPRQDKVPTGAPSVTSMESMDTDGGSQAVKEAATRSEVIASGATAVEPVEESPPAEMQQ